MADQNAIRGGGLTHEGSLRAAKRLKEVRSAAFELFFKSNFVAPFASSQHLYAKAFKRARFCVVTWPRAEISTENVKTLKDLDKSTKRGAYFSSLNEWLRSMFLSQGQVSSKMMAVREVSFTIKMSGLREVAKIWGGTVPPWGAWKPGISEYSTNPSKRRGRTILIMEDKTESWRHV